MEENRGTVKYFTEKANGREILVGVDNYVCATLNTTT